MTNVLIINGQPNPHGPSSTGRILAELAKRLPEAQIRAVADTVTEDKTYVAAEQEALKKSRRHCLAVSDLLVFGSRQNEAMD